MNKLTREQVLEKVRRLLALSQSNNEHEAAVAAAKAEQLLQEHRLTEAELEITNDAQERAALEADPLDVLGRNGTVWKGVLVYGISKLHGCYCYIDRDRNFRQRYRLIGRPSDVNSVRYLYAWLTTEIERLTQKHAGKGRTWMNSYRRGAVSGILDAMREANRVSRVQATGAALVKIDSRQIESEALAHTLNPNLRGRSSTKSRINADAYSRGQRDGRAIHTGGQLAGRSTRLLGSGR